MSATADIATALATRRPQAATWRTNGALTWLDTALSDLRGLYLGALLDDEAVPAEFAETCADLLATAAGWLVDAERFGAAS